MESVSQQLRNFVVAESPMEKTAFIILSIMAAMLAVVSFVPGGDWIYTSLLFVMGWGMLAISTAIVMVRRKLYRNFAAFILHSSFLVILVGALVTHLSGTEQTMHLRPGQTDFVGKHPVTLVDFHIRLHDGSDVADDYVSDIRVDDLDMTVSVNNVASACGYRFFQIGSDADGEGSVILATHDPIGWALTCVGYAMLFVGIVAILGGRLWWMWLLGLSALAFLITRMPVSFVPTERVGWLPAYGGVLFAISGAMAASGVLLLFVRSRWLSMSASLVAMASVVGVIASLWLASGHLPMTNGPETMLWISLFAVVATMAASRCGRESKLLPIGLIVGALAMLVAAIGLRKLCLDPIAPVLRSPLLCLHVLCVMIAYTLLTLIAGCCVVALFGRTGMMRVVRPMLLPAVCTLAAGIFIGAIWANMSWGRYWGWDPKEVWALITMLVYSMPLHKRMLSAFQADKVFATYCSVAFVSVLVTYFGVNYLLGGLHGYV